MTMRIDNSTLKIKYGPGKIKIENVDEIIAQGIIDTISPFIESNVDFLNICVLKGDNFSIKLSGERNVTIYLPQYPKPGMVRLPKEKYHTLVGLLKVYLMHI